MDKNIKIQYFSTTAVLYLILISFFYDTNYLSSNPIKRILTVVFTLGDFYEVGPETSPLTH
jgi:hypothetical protein